MGLGVAVLCLAANAASSVMGRRVNRGGRLPARLVTFVSMGVGALVLLLVGGLTQGLGKSSGQHWLIIGWLAVVNTALAFTLWNYSLRVLSAVESSILNGLMLPQIAILAYVFLQERLTMPGNLRIGAGLPGCDPGADAWAILYPGGDR